MQLRDRVDLHLVHAARVVARDDRAHASCEIPGTDRQGEEKQLVLEISCCQAPTLDGNGDSKRWGQTPIRMNSA